MNWPFVETKTHWIAVGLNEDLNVAMTNAVREAVDWLANQKFVPMSRYEAYGLVSMVGDCRVSQIVDVRKGVHCMIPKSIFTKMPRVLRRVAAFDAPLVAAPAWVGGADPVVTTSTDLKSLVEAVGGDRVSVVSLRRRSRPALVEVKPGQLAGSATAALLVQDRARSRAVAARPLRTVNNRAAPARRRDRSRRFARHRPPADRDGPRAQPNAGCTCMASATRTTGSIPRMPARSPPRSSARWSALARPTCAFEANRDALPRALEAHLAALAAALAPWPGSRVVVVHDSWPYFAGASAS